MWTWKRKFSYFHHLSSHLIHWIVVVKKVYFPSWISSHQSQSGRACKSNLPRNIHCSPIHTTFKKFPWGNVIPSLVILSYKSPLDFGKTWWVTTTMISSHPWYSNGTKLHNIENWEEFWALTIFNMCGHHVAHMLQTFVHFHYSRPCSWCLDPTRSIQYLMDIGALDTYKKPYGYWIS